MASRPEILFRLFSDPVILDGVGKTTSDSLKKLGISNLRDLIYTFPRSVIERKRLRTLQNIVLPAYATVEVEVIDIKLRNTPFQPHRITVRDEATRFDLVFFSMHQDFVTNRLPIGHRRVVSGEVGSYNNQLQMVHPDYFLAPDQAATIPEIETVYPLSEGVSKRSIRTAIQSALPLIPDLGEWLDKSRLSGRNWPNWKRAIWQMHAPSSAAGLSPDSLVRMRLAYDEIFANQLALKVIRAGMLGTGGIESRGSGELSEPIISELQFQLTTAQKRALGEILQDMAKNRRMYRLLQGDVGSGKTLVAFLALLAAVESGGQGVLMVPTGILAHQHMNCLRDIIGDRGVRFEVLTGSVRGDPRSQLLEELKAGSIRILIATHSVLRDEVGFHDLRLVVIDEQHRFGVAQRLQVADKGSSIDVLMMTATPIPRSLTLTQFGDMDISVLDELPAGRMPVKTAALPNYRIEEILTRLKSALQEGRRGYWICPLIEGQEISTCAAAEARAKSLGELLGENLVGLVHGRMPAGKRIQEMGRFRNGETQLLVATTVLEVGTDVSDASIMVVENAERFGLAQLHQMRGRVGRGNLESACALIYSDGISDEARKRIAALRATSDGFRIAEADLEIRGEGNLLGYQQSGFVHFRVADKSQRDELLEEAANEARSLLDSDPLLTSERGLAARVALSLFGYDSCLEMLD